MCSIYCVFWVNTVGYIGFNYTNPELVSRVSSEASNFRYAPVTPNKIWGSITIPHNPLFHIILPRPHNKPFRHTPPLYTLPFPLSVLPNIFTYFLKDKD